MRRVLLLLPLLGGCALLQQILAPAFQQPTLMFKEARLDRVDLAGADFTLTYAVANPNAVGLDVAQVDYALSVEDHALLSGKPSAGFRIAANGSSDVAFPAHVVWRELAPAVEALLEKEVVHYRASGTLGLDTPVGVASFPLAHEGTFAPPRLPSISIQAPRIVSIGFTGARLAIPIAIGNRNGFALPLGKLDGAVRIAGAHAGTVSLPEPPPIGAGQQAVIEIPLEVSFIESGLAVANAIKSGSADLAFDGTLSAGAARLPIHVAQKVDFAR
jgi:LEA14-like dessication related protein